MSINADSIDAEWLAEHIPGKTLLKAISLLMGSKRRGKKSGDGASTASREPSEALQLVHEQTRQVVALLNAFKKEVKDDEREFDMDTLPKGANFKLLSYLKDQETLDEVLESQDLDAIHAALDFLVENPEWKRESKKPAAKPKAAKPKAPAKKPAVVLSDSEDDEEEAKPKKAAAKPKAAKKPAKEESEDEEEAPKPAKKPAKEEKAKKEVKAKKAPAKNILSDDESEEEAPKPKAAAGNTKAKPAAKAPPKEDSDSEEEAPKPKKAVAKPSAASTGPKMDDLILQEFDGKTYNWDQDTGDLYFEGKRVGSWDGSSDKPCLASA